MPFEKVFSYKQCLYLNWRQRERVTRMGFAKIFAADLSKVQVGLLLCQMSDVENNACSDGALFKLKLVAVVKDAARSIG